MKVGVIQTAFLGDCILSLPFLLRLLEGDPESKIKIVSHGAGFELFKIALERGLSPYKDRIQIKAYNKRGSDSGFSGLRRTAAFLKDVEAVFCLQRSFRSGLLAFLSGAPARIGFSSGAATFFYTDLVRRDWDNSKPEIEKNLDLLREFFKKPVAPWNPVTSPSFLRAKTSSPRTDPRVLISVGSPWPTKRWPARHILTLVKSLIRAGVEVKIVGDESGLAIAREVESQVQSLLFENLCGKTPLREWIDLIGAADLIVSGDSAAVHVASDLNVPVISLFGPTLPEFGFAPWRKNSLTMGLSTLPCRPCHIHGPKLCPKGHHRCLEDLTGERVWGEVERLLADFKNGF